MHIWSVMRYSVLPTVQLLIRINSVTCRNIHQFFAKAVLPLQPSVKFKNIKWKTNPPEAHTHLDAGEAMWGTDKITCYKTGRQRRPFLMVAPILAAIVRDINDNVLAEIVGNANDNVN